MHGVSSKGSLRSNRRQISRDQGANSAKPLYRLQILWQIKIHTRGRFPGNGTKCSACRKTNHFALVCLSTPQKKLVQVNFVDQGNETDSGYDERGHRSTSLPGFSPTRPLDASVDK